MNSSTVSIIPPKQFSESSSFPEVERTRLAFIGMCCYLVSQCFTVPILPIGPWAVWPTLSDIAVIFLLIGSLLSLGATTFVFKPQKTIFRLLILIFLGCVCSYVTMLIVKAPLVQGDVTSKAPQFGIFQLYRLAEFIIVFWAVTKTPLTQFRIQMLNRVINVTFLFVCATIVLTFFDVVPTSTFYQHLPNDQTVAGPWIYYYYSVRQGLGTIGYNHAYVALQIIMLLALKLHLMPKPKSFAAPIFTLIAIIIVFLTGSRAGLAALLFFAAITLFNNLLKISIGIVALGIFLLSITPQQLYDDSIPILSRQLTLLQSYDSENLSGRDGIWSSYIDHLNEDPIRWFVGDGFGTNIEMQNNAHNLYLNIVSELGLTGLFIFASLMWVILRNSYRIKPPMRYFFWVTVALLLSSLTQETFYPVASLGHFIGFYLLSLAIALQSLPAVDELSV